jgi:hypothetical protein
MSRLTTYCEYETEDDRFRSGMDFACVERVDCHGLVFRFWSLDASCGEEIRLFLVFRRHTVSRIGVSINWALLISRMHGRRGLRLVRHSVSDMRSHKSILNIAILIGGRSCVPIGIVLSSALGHCYCAVEKKRF